MKLRSTPANDTVIGSLEHDGEYRTALMRFEALQENLKLHEKKLRDLEMRSSRLGHDARSWLTMHAASLPTMTDAEFDACAQQIADAGSLPDDLLLGLRKRKPIPRFQQPDDIADAAEVQDARAGLDLFRRAVQLGRRDLEKTRTKVLPQLLRGVAPERERVGKRLAAALVELLCAIREEHTLGASLQRQDECLPRQVSPPIAGTSMVLQEDVEQFLQQAARLGWLSHEQMDNLAALGMTTGVPA